MKYNSDYQNFLKATGLEDKPAAIAKLFKCSNTATVSEWKKRGVVPAKIILEVILSGAAKLEDFRPA